MCAPFIVESVREEVSRRGFIGAVAACAVTASMPADAQQKAVRLPKGFRDVVDLTHPFSPSLPVYPGYKPLQTRERFSVARDGFAANEVTFDEHTGTHVDAPSHFVAGAASADRLPVDRLVAPLAVISVADRAAKGPDTLVSVDDLLQWEKRHGRIPAGALRGDALRLGCACDEHRPVPESRREGHDAHAGIQRAGGALPRR